MYTYCVAFSLCITVKRHTHSILYLPHATNDGANSVYIIVKLFIRTSFIRFRIDFKSSFAILIFWLRFIRVNICDRINDNKVLANNVWWDHFSPTAITHLKSGFSDEHHVRAICLQFKTRKFWLIFVHLALFTHSDQNFTHSFVFLTIVMGQRSLRKRFERTLWPLRPAHDDVYTSNWKCFRFVWNRIRCQLD